MQKRVNGDIKNSVYCSVQKNKQQNKYQVCAKGGQKTQRSRSCR